MTSWPEAEIDAKGGTHQYKPRKQYGSREQEILNLRFGLDSGESQTLKEIVDELGISRGRVRQIEKRALRRLRTIGSNYSASPRLQRWLQSRTKKR